MKRFQRMPAQCAACGAITTGFCANLSLAAIESIACVSRAVSVCRDQRVPLRKDQAVMVLILKHGMIKVSNTLKDGRQQIIDFLGAGDVLVWRANDAAFNKSVEAVSDADLCELDYPALMTLSTAAPEVSQSLLAATMGEVDRKNEQVMMLGRKRSDERVASFLLALCERARERGEPPGRLRLPMSRAEIADYLGLTTETVSRAFTALREEGLILLPKPQEVEIGDFAALSEIAAGGGWLPVK